MPNFNFSIVQPKLKTISGHPGLTYLVGLISRLNTPLMPRIIFDNTTLKSNIIISKLFAGSLIELPIVCRIRQTPRTLFSNLTSMMLYYSSYFNYSMYECFKTYDFYSYLSSNHLDNIKGELQPYATRITPLNHLSREMSKTRNHSAALFGPCHQKPFEHENL